MLRFSIFTVALILSLNCFPSCRFPSYRATYKLYINGISVGRVKEDVSKKGSREFHYYQAGKASFFLLSDRFTLDLNGMIKSNGFRPVTSEFKRKVNDIRVNRKYKVNTYDPTSYLLQIRYGLLKGQVPARLNIYTSGKKIMPFYYRRYSPRSYSSAYLGNIMLTPVSFMGQEGTTGVDWFSKKYGYLLVYSEKKNKKSKISMKLDLISYKPNYKQCIVY